MTPPRRGLLPACAALALVALLAACSGSPTSTTRAAAPSQRLVYRVVDSSAGAARVTTVVVDSLPPYLGRSVTLDGAPPGGRSLGGAAWDADQEYLLRAGGGAAVVQQLAPGPSGVTTYLPVALDAAERHHLVRRAGTATVAGTACTRWLSKEPLDSASVTAATAADRTVSCVDERGRLLEDEWTLAGRVVRTRTAVSAGDGPSLTGAELLHGATPQPVDASALRERVQSKPVDVLAAAFGIPVPAAPPGFALDRSTAFITLDQSGETRTEGIALTYRSGRRVVVLRLEQGLRFRLATPGGGVPVRLADGRPARLSALPTGVRLQLEPRPGRVATVVSALEEQPLLAWVGALRLARP